MKWEKIRMVLLSCMLLPLICGCGKEEEVSGQGSVRYAEVAVEIADDGNDLVYAFSSRGEFEAAVDSSFWLGNVVYDGRHYFLDVREKRSAGFLTENGSYEYDYFIATCRLGEDAAAQETVLELSGMTGYEGFGGFFIQEGLLCCSWQTAEGIQKHVVVDLDSEPQPDVSEFLVPEGREVKAVVSTGYYYLEDGKIYFSKYENGKGNLFYECDGKVCGLYRDGAGLCAFVENAGAVSVVVLDKKGRLQVEYKGLEQAGELVGGSAPALVAEKNGILYYILNAKKEGTSYNHWLIRADLLQGTRKVCGGWYRKQSLDAELEHVVKEYLNHFFWCNPDDMPQEAAVYPYQIYKTAEEGEFPETYLKLGLKEDWQWFCCTYARWQEYYIEPLRRELPEGLWMAASGEIAMSDVKQPVFQESDWKSVKLQNIERALGNLCCRAFEEEYWAGEVFEVYLSDFCPENGMMPVMYIFCGDEVCELQGSLGHSDTWRKEDMELDFRSLNEKGLFDITAKEGMDKDRFERIRKISVLHMECKKDEEPRPWPGGND